MNALAPDNRSPAPLVGIIMGSQSDWPTLAHAAQTLAGLDVPHETRIVSAHRTPDRLRDYAVSASGRGLRVIIAGAGGAAHLPPGHASNSMKFKQQVKMRALALMLAPW